MVGDIDFEYDIDLEWDDISNLPCADDDAGTCSDAPDIYIDCLLYGDCDDGLMMNSTVGVNTFTGWAHSALDYRDFYNFDVPQDYGIEITMYADTSTSYSMTLYSSTGSFLDSCYDCDDGTNNVVNTNQSSTFTGGEIVALYVRANIITIQQLDGTPYPTTYSLSIPTVTHGWIMKRQIVLLHLQQVQHTIH